MYPEAGLLWSLSDELKRCWLSDYKVTREIYEPPQYCPFAGSIAFFVKFVKPEVRRGPVT